MKRSGRLERKTELRNTTPLKPGGSLSRSAPLAAGQPKPKPAPRDTGPTRTVRHTVKARAGMCCERCGVSVAATGHHVHHRQPRQMGGSSRPEINCPSNLLLLCAPRCHSEVESSRQISYERGWLVRPGHNPATSPVWIAGRGWTFLRDDGTYAPTERNAA
jgi:hypothetical protein